MKPEPAATTRDVITLTIRLPTGNVLKRRFAKSQTLEEVVNYCKVELNVTENVRLLCSYPRKPYADLKMLVGTAFPTDSMTIAEIQK